MRHYGDFTYESETDTTSTPIVGFEEMEECDRWALWGYDEGSDAEGPEYSEDGWLEAAFESRYEL
jgi:hypothetical protein